ncbi:tyrosine-tRNA ligase [Anaeramoeba ignava]|uniref:tyrosine--tRNA ligase n=1 Tax=Anaeramoeba ignava TaxID=1746090 RepID=A0A9Q0LHU1_ANAIG|nr:tyrosine-tRNA ligase [Anaeramoeba ignava]|eukprot:Anaeramoba_ignava/a487539_198.p1 GENE.a487539_198~~a487539_198.p1  ORF type:complete len:389 (-),score=126.54 a487539_198:62-1228(-)
MSDNNQEKTKQEEKQEIQEENDEIPKEIQEPKMDFNFADEEHEKRYKTIRSIGEECILDTELFELLSRKKTPIAYDGFEPSGRMHIAQGILKSINVNKLTSSGCKFIFWIADWFAMMNNKFDGDLKKIQTVGKYMIEIWKACGMNMENVSFVWSSEEIISRGGEYWPLVIDIARRNSVKRIQRCSQIMGRSDPESLSASQIFYPCMQAADIFFLKADICQLGLDQRKVNVLAREYCDLTKRKFKPIILSHHMILGLKEGQEKMSKSDPMSAIFMEDTEVEVNSKIKKAFCPPKVIEKNPIFDYLKYLIFEKFAKLEVIRKEKDGGNIVYNSYDEVVKDYVDGKLHPADLKKAVATNLNKLLEPVREHFVKDETAKKLLAQVKKFKTKK